MTDFSQQFCWFSPYDSKLTTVLSQNRNCLVTVGNGTVTVTQAPSTQLYRAPAASLQVVVPNVAGKLGGVYLVDAEHRWLVDFSHTYQGAMSRTPGGKLKLFAGLGNISGIKAARRTEQEFVDAMVSNGAHLDTQ